jgi:hypothetical protein
MAAAWPGNVSGAQGAGRLVPSLPLKIISYIHLCLASAAACGSCPRGEDAPRAWRRLAGETCLGQVSAPCRLASKGSPFWMACKDAEGLPPFTVRTTTGEPRASMRADLPSSPHAAVERRASRSALRLAGALLAHLSASPGICAADLRVAENVDIMHRLDSVVPHCLPVTGR